MRKTQENLTEAFRRVVELDRQGNFDRAERLCRALLATQSKNFDVLHWFGTFQYRRGKHAEAIHFLSAALKIRPTEGVAWSNLALVHASLNHPEEALPCFDRLIALSPDNAEAHNNRGNALLELGRAEAALASYEKALAFKPDYAEALSNRGNVLRILHRLDEALASCDKALAIKPKYAEAHNNRGNALSDLRRPEAALASYDNALALKPDYAEAHDNRGLMLAELGYFENAIEAIGKAIKLAPRRIRPYYNLTLLKRMSPSDPRLEILEKFERELFTFTLGEQVELKFALGKAFADIGDHERSFRSLRHGNALRRTQTVYDEAATLKLFERTTAVFNRMRMRSIDGGEVSSAPVFILGMPRSGTTLIEQILASHPDVFGAGETMDFERAMAGLGGLVGRALHAPEAVSLISREQFRQVGASYVERVRHSAPVAARITNKMTDNARLVGLIHMALPNARIIHVHRCPLDTCLSCFTQLFVGRVPYAYDLGELGRYYRAYEGLMTHWRTVLPPNVMLDVRYEAVVADLEGQTRRLLAHCGLESDARCLDFHQTKRPVRTASLTQVRQPIYTSSIGRWRAYERFLEPLLAELEPSMRPDQLSIQFTGFPDRGKIVSGLNNLGE